MDQSRREFMFELGIIVAGSMLALPALSKDLSNSLIGFSKIYNNGNHEIGAYAKHGDYDSNILSAYQISNRNKLMLHVNDVAQILRLWDVIGNAGWFEDYNFDKPSALYLENGDLQQNIVEKRGTGVLTVSLDNKLDIHHVSEFNYDFLPYEKDYNSAVQGTLLQYDETSLISISQNESKYEIPRIGLAVGKEGIFYLILKKGNQHKFISEATRLYQSYVAVEIPNIIQLDSGPSAQMIIKPRIANSHYVKNIDGKYIGSQLTGDININHSSFDYTKFEPRETKVANFLLLSSR